MKRAWHLIICMLAAGLLTACMKDVSDEFGGEKTFVKIYGSAFANEGNALAQTPDRGFLIAGTSVVSNNVFSLPRLSMRRTDALGNLIRQDTLGLAANQLRTQFKVRQLITEPGTDRYISLAEVNTEAGARFPLISRLAADGTLLDTATIYWLPRNVTPGKIIPAATGGEWLFIGTMVSVSDPTTTQMVVTRIRASLRQPVWTRVYGLEGKSDVGEDIAELPNGDLLWCGTVDKGNPNAEKVARMVRTNQIGNLIWDKIYDYGLPSPGGPISPNVSVTVKQMYVSGNQTYLPITVSVSATNFSNTGVAWMRLDTQTGDTLATRSIFPTPGYTVNHFVPSGGGFLLTGQRAMLNTSPDIYLAMIDPSGQLRWTQQYGGNGADVGHQVIVTQDGGIAVIGTLDFESNRVAVLIKTNEQGLLSNK